MLAWQSYCKGHSGGMHPKFAFVSVADERSTTCRIGNHHAYKVIELRRCAVVSQAIVILLVLALVVSGGLELSVRTYPNSRRSSVDTSLASSAADTSTGWSIQTPVIAANNPSYITATFAAAASDVTSMPSTPDHTLTSRFSDDSDIASLSAYPLARR